jgi:hypothetical protein
MPSGGPGDDPILDITHWRQPVYSPTVDSLIAELAELWGSQVRLEDYLDEQHIRWMQLTDVELVRAESILSAKRDDLYRTGKASGWDMDDLDSRIKAQREAVAAAWKQST